jgi:hypothetical protein
MLPTFFFVNWTFNFIYCSVCSVLSLLLIFTSFPLTFLLKNCSEKFYFSSFSVGMIHRYISIFIFFYIGTFSLFMAMSQCYIFAGHAIFIFSLQFLWRERQKKNYNISVTMPFLPHCRHCECWTSICEQEIFFIMIIHKYFVIKYYVWGWKGEMGNWKVQMLKNLEIKTSMFQPGSIPRRGIKKCLLVIPSYNLLKNWIS